MRENKYLNTLILSVAIMLYRSLSTICCCFRCLQKFQQGSNNGIATTSASFHVPSHSCVDCCTGDVPTSALSDISASSLVTAVPPTVDVILYIVKCEEVYETFSASVHQTFNHLCHVVSPHETAPEAGWRGIVWTPPNYPRMLRK